MKKPMFLLLFCWTLLLFWIAAGCSGATATAEDKANLEKIKANASTQQLEPGQRPGFRTDGYPHETTEP